MKPFSALKKNLKKDCSHLPLVKVALLGDTSTQLLSQALKGTGVDAGLNLEVWEADFNQVEQQVLTNQSELYEFNPDVIILFQSTHKLLQKYNKLNPSEYVSLANDRLTLIDSFYTTITAKSNAKIIYYNYTETDDVVFGNYANKMESSFLFQLRKLNYELMGYAARQAGFYICDISTVQNQFGKATFFQPHVYISTDMVLSIDILPPVAYKTVDLISALFGRLKKCLIVDLDDTIWGGVIGDDGIENIQLGSLGIGKAFTELQYWIKKLKNRGIILAVSSKNTEAIAKEPFEKHPDMVLRLDDIAIFNANWDNKVDNIRQIQAALNIGFDSMVFLDDNPFERNMVREHLPTVTIPELPEDPANYLEYLYSLNLFETTSVTNEDTERVKQYQTEAKRNVARQASVNEDAFLESLSMASLVEPFNSFNTPRVAQLSMRSNQFNLRTVRYTEADIKKMALAASHFTFSFTLEDKFGDNGLVSVVIMQKETANTLFIDSWFMSCRVLKRGMENFTLNTLANFARENGFKYLKGEYITTSKNEIVKDHYAGLGFRVDGAYWLLDVDDYQPKKTFINLK